MQPAQFRHAWRSALVLAVAAFAYPLTTVAASEVESFRPETSSRNEAPSPDRLMWSDFVSDVLGSRLTGAVDEVVSVAFFKSLLRAVSYGEAPDIGGPYTLFLPVDSAFARYPGATLDAVLHDRTSLGALVAAHIVPGSITREDLKDGEALVSLQGEAIAAEWVGRPFVNGAAVIGSAELEHGVVHFIDRLL